MLKWLIAFFVGVGISHRFQQLWIFKQLWVFRFLCFHVI